MASRSNVAKLSLKTHIRRMRTPIVGDIDEYYAVTLLADAEGQMFFDIQTIWAGYSDEENRVELREGRLVYGSRMAKLWNEMGEPALYVRSETEFQIYLLLGGHGLLAPKLAESLVPDWLAPQPSYQHGFSGFRSPGLFERNAFRRAPTPKLRMKVLNRDHRRCRICGRRPDDHIDIELHVHHIRPWGIGGLTDVGNLITLCHTCHNGIDPHFDPSLFFYLESRQRDDRFTDFKQGVAHYRRAVTLSAGSNDSD